MDQYQTLSLANRRRGENGLAYIPPEVFRDTVWEYLTYPHERRGKHVIAYNKCLLDLPKPRIYPGPRIVHGFGGYRDVTMVKFIYTIHHAKNPNSYITIHEYTTMQTTTAARHFSSRTAQLWKSCDHQQIKCLRSQYMERVCK